VGRGLDGAGHVIGLVVLAVLVGMLLASAVRDR
jgi:hypothetical protein